MLLCIITFAVYRSLDDVTLKSFSFGVRQKQFREGIFNQAINQSRKYAAYKLVIKVFASCSAAALY